MAFWTYAPCTVTSGVDEAFNRYRTMVADYWSPQRVHVETGYQHIQVPFAALNPPTFSIVKKMDLTAFMGYLSTWSSTRNYNLAFPETPALQEIFPYFAEAWGEEATHREVSWQLHLRVFRL
ncbi:MAG: hypothetical protein AAGI38_01035 [Bacteroidota bacterium]